MTRQVVFAALAGWMALLGATGNAQSTQAPPPPAAADAQVTEASLERIRKGLDRVPTTIFDGERLRFYALVIAKEPTAKEIIGKYDLRYGPTRGGNPMSHQEFLNMVTPRELYGSGGISAGELLQFGLVNWLGRAIIEKGISALHKARTEREVQEIRERIDRELEALRRRGGGTH